MQTVAIYKYFKFGAHVRFLQDMRANNPVHNDDGPIANIEALQIFLDQLNLAVSKRAFEPINEILTELRAVDQDAKITQAQATALNRAVTAFRLTLHAELKGSDAFVVSPKRMDPQKLLNNVSALLAPGVFSKLSDIAKYDIGEAAKCIAFERPTAAAFHLMRATEDALRGLYCFFVKKNRMNPKLWAPMVKALQSHRRAKTHVTLLQNLDNLRASFRNPTQHPEKIYDIQEAQDLWSLSVDVINRIHKIQTAS